MSELRKCYRHRIWSCGHIQEPSIEMVPENGPLPEPKIRTLQDGTRIHVAYGWTIEEAQHAAEKFKQENALPQ